ncbi:MAG: hypothetical protein F6K19_26895, partial [Cyanothece sp. SIO1E1]|nr:hypothetical protein [Cyanothece sp. SIO1E1]
MDDTGLSEKSKNVSASPIDDIPEAVREAPNADSSSLLKRLPRLWKFMGLAAIALCVSLVIAWQVPQLRLGQSVNPSTSIGSTRVEEPNSVDADAKTD